MLTVWHHSINILLINYLFIFVLLINWLCCVVLRVEAITRLI